jgi:hypothetical protein
VFDRRTEGRELTFGVSGKLIMNNLVMYDRQTNSLWLQISGEGIEGSFKGAALDRVPHVQTTWSAWREEHPDTLVLDKSGGYRGDPYASYYRDSGSGPLGQSRDDDRLPPKDLVIGYIFGGSAKGYPFQTLLETPIVNDTFAGRDLLVVFDGRSQTGQIFERVVDGHILTFELAPTVDGDLLLRDRETGSTWSGFSGEALDGPLIGQGLLPLPIFYAFWFAWTDFFVEAELYEGRPRG